MDLYRVHDLGGGEGVCGEAVVVSWEALKPSVKDAAAGQWPGAGLGSILRCRYGIIVAFEGYAVRVVFVVFSSPWSIKYGFHCDLVLESSPPESLTERP